MAPRRSDRRIRRRCSTPSHPIRSRLRTRATQPTFFPALESGDEPDSQVDALANGRDARFDEVVANTAELFVSVRPDPFGPNGYAVFREFPSGTTAPVWLKSHLNNPNAGANFVGEVDALELWGPVGADDANFYSLNGDVTSTSVFAFIGGTPLSYLSQAQIHSEVAGLGFVGTQQQVDVDALMVKDADGNGVWSAGDEVLFSVRAAPGMDGGEIVHWEFGASATFLVHGGHVWNTAFNVITAFGLGAGQEDIDAHEAAPPGQVVSPAATIRVLGPAAAALLGAALLGVAALALRARAG
jgi:hypothetical protein